MADLPAIARVVAIALACGAALVATNWLTEDPIRFNEASALRAAIAELLPAGTAAPDYPPELDRVPGAWQLCSGHLLGRSNTPGYGGDIELLYTLLVRTAEPGQPATRQLERLTVLGHYETPGIADFLSDPDWLGNFRGADAERIENLSAVTGATITSVAVRDHLGAVLRDPVAALGQATLLDCDP